jgi:hypothetical protein
MSVEDFRKYKKKKKKSGSEPNTSWQKSVYNPRIFRGQKKPLSQKNTSYQPAEQKEVNYVSLLIVVMVVILGYAVMKKYGLVE